MKILNSLLGLYAFCSGTTFCVLYASNIYNSKYLLTNAIIIPSSSAPSQMAQYIFHLYGYFFVVFGGMMIKSLWLASIFPIMWYDIIRCRKDKKFMRHLIPLYELSPQYYEYKNKNNKLH